MGNQFIPQTLELLLSSLGMFFSFWPLLIFAPLTWKKSKGIRAMFAIWVLLAVLRVALLFSPNSLHALFIEEPLNTMLFVGAGVVLMIGAMVAKQRETAKFQRKAQSLSQIEDFLNLSPSDFESMIVELYRLAGHQAQRTGASGDHGVDIVVQAKNGEKWVVQCKRWRGSVGEPVVRDFYGVVQHEKADKGIIFTTGRFSAPAQRWVKGKPISLYDGDQLVNLWERAQASQRQQKTVQHYT